MAETPDPRFIPLVPPEDRRHLRTLGFLSAFAFSTATFLGSIILWSAPNVWPAFGLYFLSFTVAALEIVRRYRAFIDDILVFDQEGLTLVRRGKIVVKVSWSEFEGYDLDGEGTTLTLYRVGQESFQISALRRSRLPTLTTLVKVMDALDRAMLPTARRDRGFGKFGRIRDLQLTYGDRPPAQKLVPGTAYRYIDPIELEKHARSNKKLQSIMFLMVGSIGIAGLTPPNPGLLETSLAVGAILVCVAAAFLISRRTDTQWDKFRRTVRGTIMAVEGGIKFSGDSRTYHRVIAPAESKSRMDPIYETYAAGKETILVATCYLEPTEPPLTALTPHSANAELDLETQAINLQTSNREDPIMES